jgi:hypothetical protein
MNTTTQAIVFSRAGSSDLRIEVSRIFGGYGPRAVALRAVEKGHPNRRLLAEQLARSPASQRDSRWKSGLRSMLLPWPMDSENEADYVSRARAEIDRIMA